MKTTDMIEFHHAGERACIYRWEDGTSDKYKLGIFNDLELQLEWIGPGAMEIKLVFPLRAKLDALMEAR